MSPRLHRTRVVRGGDRRTTLRSPTASNPCRARGCRSVRRAPWRVLLRPQTLCDVLAERVCAGRVLSPPPVTASHNLAIPSGSCPARQIVVPKHHAPAGTVTANAVTQSTSLTRW